MNIASIIKNELTKASKPISNEKREFVVRYLGTKRAFLNVKASNRDKILREATREIKKLPPEKSIKILDELFSSNIFEDFNFGGKLLSLLPEIRKNIKFVKIEQWLTVSNGWAECDTICQSLMSEAEVLERWSKWQSTIIKLSKSKNIQHRRASLVLQVKPVGKSNNKKIRALAYQIIESLKSEKDILITRAISWLLRALSNQNKDEVMSYLNDNQTSLPKIAYRETMKKITTGKK